ncbi:MAG: rRNA maturation RNase YbeY [Actinomycetota bacterium]|nr:rRNA maturation RNase YbeY [Actinomycetota bacterium]
MLEIEAFGDGLPHDSCVHLAGRTLAACGVTEGHLAITFVDPPRIRELNVAHRGVDSSTDVLSFPIDGPAPTAGPRELGDVVVCPQQTDDLEEAVVHGVLHLCGFDHEADDGEMLVLQKRVLVELRDI